MSFMPAYTVLLFDEFSWVITPLLAVFQLVLFMTVPRPLLCALCRSESVFHYNTRFVITLISLGHRNERFNEVAVYSIHSFVCSFNLFIALI